MKVIAQMDEMLSININTDSTFALLLEAQNRGYEIFYYLPKNLVLEGRDVKAFCHKIKLQNKLGDHCIILESCWLDLSKFDLILFRQDPPFDMNYITSSYILDKIKDRVLIINDPNEIRNCAEKIFVTDFAEFMPPTIISSNLDQIRQFKKNHQEIVIKPLYSSGGDGIFHIKNNDDNFNSALEMMTNFYKTPLIAQKFLPQVAKGDKRILLLDGEPIGAVLRVAQGNEFRNNIHLGGKVEKAQLTKREKMICERIGPELKRRGLVFVGIDVIDGYLTEINITSPTCIIEINNLNQTRLEEMIWDCFEKKIEDH